MQILYIIIILAMSVFFICRRKIDMFALWFASIIAISQPYMVGYFYIPPLINTPENINASSYLVIFITLFVIFFSSLFYDYKYKHTSHCLYVNPYLNKIYGYSSALACLAIIFMIISFYYIGLEKFYDRRSGGNLGAIESGLISKTILFSMYAAFFGFYTKNTASTIVGLFILIAMYSVSPSRSFLFITFLSLIMVVFIPKNRVKLSFLFKYFPVLLLLLAFIVLGKVYREFDGGLFDALATYINISLEGDRVTFREANYIAANLHHSIESLKAGEMIIRVFYYPLMLFPFLYLGLVFIGLPPIPMFSKIILNIHDFDRFGVGSSFWGEMYAVGGWFVIVAIALLFSFIVTIVNRKASQNSMRPFSLTMFIPTIYIVSYSYRLDMTLLLNRFSEAILIYIMYLFYVLIKFKNNR